MNMFDAVNNVGRVMKFFGSEIEKSKRYRQRPAVQVTPPAIPPAEGSLKLPCVPMVCGDVFMLPAFRAARCIGSNYVGRRFYRNLFLSSSR